MKNNSISSSARANTLLTFGSKSLYFLLTFAVGIIVARTAGPEGKGIYSLIVLTCGLASIITGFGIPTANACFAGRKHDEASSLVRNSLLWLIISTAFLGIVLVVLWLTGIVEPGKLKYVGIAFAITPFLLLTTLLVEVLHGLNRIAIYNFILVAVPLVQLIVLLVLLKKLSLGLAVMSWALSQVIGVGLAGYALRKHANLGSIDKSVLKQSLIFGAQVWLGQLIGTLSLRFDMYLVAYYLGTTQVGYYSIAAALSGFLFYIPSSIAVVALPRFTSVDARSASTIALQGMRVALFSSISLMILLLGIGKFIVPLLYGQAFFSAVKPLFILLPGVAVYGMAHITTAYFNGHLGKPFINTGLALLALIIDVGLNIILIPRMGINGAAISCTISYIVAMVVCLWIFVRLSGVPIKEILIVRKDDFTQILNLRRRS
jgi:O-antigen/teichoic acid export membrane protein